MRGSLCCGIPATGSGMDADGSGHTRPYGESDYTNRRLLMLLATRRDLRPPGGALGVAAALSERRRSLPR